MPDNVLAGAVDMHTHPHPSLMDRGFDFVTEALEAEAAGMRAVVLKDHLMSTASTLGILKSRRQELFGKELKVELIGSIVLNNHVGGLDPFATEVALEMGAKVVWLPTISARGHYEALRAAPAQRGPFARLNTMRPLEPIDIVDAEGKVVPSLMEVFELIKKHDAVLATGHVAPAQTMAMLPQARAIGLERIVVTHPTMAFVNASPEQMAEMVRQGAYLEHEAGFWEPARAGGQPIQSLIDMIDTYGAAHTVLSTDLGNAGAAHPAAGLESVATSLLEHGVSPSDLDLLIRTNPYQLLGLHS